MNEGMDVGSMWRMDITVMLLDSKKFDREWWNMVATHAVKAALRVAINDDGTVDLIDFTMPSLRGTLRKSIPQSDVPTWVMRNVCVLRISEEGDYVKDIGVKINDYLYYLEPKEGED
jgi:hypothetical protein